MLRSRTRSSSAPNSSPTNSPRKKRNRLSMPAGVANLFVKMLSSEEKAINKDEMELTSGDPKTHPNVAEGAQDQDKVLVEQTDHFVCAGGVHLARLLQITRNALMEHAERELGANAVIDEQWVCTISGPKPVHSRTYKILIRYTASATMSSAPNYRHHPVALDQATSIPGVMSILKRNDA